ncbi:MAG: 16S rRNA (uracil(1498)-N(3))-methyltransferase [Candidatus Omnitrophota bacterium]
MSRFYIPHNSIRKDRIHIRGREAHHVRDVMRLNIGDEIVVFDGTGYEYVGTIEQIGKNDIVAKINKKIKREISNFRLALAQAIPKSNKMDLIVEKATELGVERIIPIVTGRTIVKIDETKMASKINRWKKLAIEASKQSGRVTVPEINEIKSFEDSLSYTKYYELAVIPCLHEGIVKLKDVLKSNGVKSAILFIGPEGDFTEDEINIAKSKGVKPVSLGREVLRSETAAISALSVLNYELRW